MLILILLGVVLGVLGALAVSVSSALARYSTLRDNAGMAVGEDGLAMKRLSIRLGFWSAALIVAVFVVFTACFLIIPLTAPLFLWSDLAGYLAYAGKQSQLLAQVAQLVMLLFGPLFVVLLCCMYELAGGERRLFARISLCFGGIFATLTGINYFLQVSVVPQSIGKGQTQGLEQVLQANPLSAVAGVNMLGWTLFFGLSSLFVAWVFPLFDESVRRAERVARVAFLANAIFCLLGGVAFTLDIVPVVFLTMDLGMGAAVLVAAVSLCILFRKMERAPNLSDSVRKAVATSVS